MRRFRDMNGTFRSTGVPKGWSELPSGYFLYMLVAAGRIVFVSAGKDPWAVATRLQRKYKADRVLYMPTSYLKAEEAVAALVAHYQPPYNFKAQSTQLAELDALMSEAEN